jgi:hypothetical protein
MMILEDTFTLANCVTIPKLGLGTWLIPTTGRPRALPSVWDRLRSIGGACPKLVEFVGPGPYPYPPPVRNALPAGGEQTPKTPGASPVTIPSWFAL